MKEDTPLGDPSFHKISAWLQAVHAVDLSKSVGFTEHTHCVRVGTVTSNDAELPFFACHCHALKMGSLPPCDWYPRFLRRNIAGARAKHHRFSVDNIWRLHLRAEWLHTLNYCAVLLQTLIWDAVRKLDTVLPGRLHGCPIN